MDTFVKHFLCYSLLPRSWLRPDYFPMPSNEEVPASPAILLMLFKLYMEWENYHLPCRVKACEKFFVTR